MKMENLATLIYNKTVLGRISTVRNCLILQGNENQEELLAKASGEKKPPFGGREKRLISCLFS